MNAWKGKGRAAKIADFVPKFATERLWPTVQTIKQRLGTWLKGMKRRHERKQSKDKDK